MARTWLQRFFVGGVALATAGATYMTFAPMAKGRFGNTHLTRLERAMHGDHNDRENVRQLGRHGDLDVLERMYNDPDITCDEEVFEAVNDAIPRKGAGNFIGRLFSYELAFDEHDNERIATEACDSLIQEHNPDFELQHDFQPFVRTLLPESPLQWGSLSPQTERAIDSYRRTEEVDQHLRSLNSIGPNTETLTSRIGPLERRKFAQAIADQDTFIQGMAPADPASESITDYVDRLNAMTEYGVIDNRKWFQDDTTYIGTALALQSVARELTNQSSPVQQTLSTSERNSLLQKIQGSYQRMNHHRTANQPVLGNTDYVGISTLGFADRNLAQELTDLGSTEVTAIANSFDPSSTPSPWSTAGSYSNPDKPGAGNSSFVARRWREFQDTLSL